MYLQKILVCTLICLISGCTSFKTTALFRLANDSVVPECRDCNKLNGLPVKLKVPSHVCVVIYEQQLLLANSPDDQKTLEGAVTAKAAALKAALARLNGLDTAVGTWEKELELAEAEIDKSSQAVEKAKMDVNTDPMNEEKKARLAQAKNWQNAAIKRAATAMSSLVTAEENTANRDAFEQGVQQARAELDAATDAATVGYTLVSFTPAQLIVETELEYTDKVFMVDFRRPGGGILNLSEASMDDEQYFAKIQAEVTERTMADVSTAIETLQGPLTNRPGTNMATPTSADTPEGEESDGVNFQKSVVAFKRFDISEPCWEERMMQFVNSRLGTSLSTPDNDYISLAPDASGHEHTQSGTILYPSAEELPQIGDVGRIFKSPANESLPPVSVLSESVDDTP